MAYHWTLHIDAPPERVFDTLADVECDVSRHRADMSQDILPRHDRAWGW